jgi:hypothetical protein
MIGNRSTQAVAMLLGFAMLGTSTPSVAAAVSGVQAPVTAPSRAAEKGCAWETFSDAKLGLDAWVQRCNFGKRKIDFVAIGNSLAQRYSDSSGAPELVIAVLDLLPGETPEQGIRRLFALRTDRKLSTQCVLTPYRGNGGIPAGVKRYTFLPNAALKKTLNARPASSDVPEPACGAWGDDPDGIQYFEVQPASAALRKVLFVRAGQDTPLFDEATLRIR